jgi:hypothetical protein
MGLLDSGKTWLFGLAAKKVSKRAAVFLCSTMAAKMVDAQLLLDAGLATFGDLLAALGVNFSVTLTAPNETAVAAALFVLAETGRNIAKTKWPEQFGWL